MIEWLLQYIKLTLKVRVSNHWVTNSDFLKLTFKNLQNQSSVKLG